MKDVAKDMAKVAAGVGLVVAASISRLRFQDLGSFAFQTLKGFTDNASRIARLNNKDWVHDFVNSEAELKGLREVRGRRRNRNYKSPSWRSIDNLEVRQNLRNHGQKKTDQMRSGRAQRDDSQPEELFAPKKAEASRESRPFKSYADFGGGSLSQQLALPSVTPHFPLKKSRD